VSAEKKLKKKIAILPIRRLGYAINVQGILHIMGRSSHHTGGMRMSLECKCDECNKYIDVDNSVFCTACFNSLLDRIRELEREVEKLTVFKD